MIGAAVPTNSWTGVNVIAFVPWLSEYVPTPETVSVVTGFPLPSTSVAVPLGCQKAATYQLTSLTLGVCAALLWGGTRSVQAQDAPVAQEAQAQRTVAFDIASQPLASA